MKIQIIKSFFAFTFAVLIQLNPAHAQLGSATRDLVYTPVTPCRLLDTRPTFGGSGPIAASGVKTFAVSGVANYTAQGGSATNCGMAAVGANARAIAVYLTVVTPAASGWITAYENSVTAPAAATVNFKAGDVLGNTTIVPVTPGTAGLAGNSYMNIFASSATNVVGDIVGYYSKPVSTGSFECIDSASGVATLPANGIVAVYSVACSIGYVITGGSCIGNSSGANVTASQIFDNRNYCAYKNSLASEASVEAIGRCCRIPGR